jgi:GNAT superfamily N-acetyltransferase
VNIAELCALYDQDQRRDVEYPFVRREVTPHVIRNVDLAGWQGYVIYSRLDATNADAIIAEQIAYFENLGQDFEWKLFEQDSPSDLRDRLRTHGFEIGEKEAIMVLDMDSAPATLLEPIGHDVRRITDPEQVKSVLSVQSRVWGDANDFLKERLANELRSAPEFLSVYAVYADDTPVCSAWINFPAHSRFASLWGGSTLSAYRQRGYYTALLAVRLQEARQRGACFLTVDASPMSRPILEKFGFQRISTAYACTWHVQKAAV